MQGRNIFGKYISYMPSLLCGSKNFQFFLYSHFSFCSLLFDRACGPLNARLLKSKNPLKSFWHSLMKSSDESKSDECHGRNNHKQVYKCLCQEGPSQSQASLHFFMLNSPITIASKFTNVYVKKSHHNHKQVYKCLC